MVTPLGFTFLYSASSSSVHMDMAMRDTGTWREGIMFFATAACMPLRGTWVPEGGQGAAATGGGGAGGRRGGAAAAAGAGAAAGVEEGTPAAASTSPAVMRPLRPEPATVARSTLSFFASFLA